MIVNKYVQILENEPVLLKKDLHNAYQFSAPACEKAWIYERVPGFELAGYDDKIEKAVLTRKECQEKCLKDTDLPCRSAEYDYTTFTCRLSRETRRSQPAAYRYYHKSNFNFVVELQTNDYLYRATTDDVDYLENQCADSRSYGMCDYQEYPESDLGFGDLQITTRSKEEVKLSFCLLLFSGQAEVANSHRSDGHATSLIKSAQFGTFLIIQTIIICFITDGVINHVQ